MAKKAAPKTESTPPHQPRIFTEADYQKAAMEYVRNLKRDWDQQFKEYGSPSKAFEKLGLYWRLLEKLRELFDLLLVRGGYRENDSFIVGWFPNYEGDKRSYSYELMHTTLAIRSELGQIVGKEKDIYSLYSWPIDQKSTFFEHGGWSAAQAFEGFAVSVFLPMFFEHETQKEQTPDDKPLSHDNVEFLLKDLAPYFLNPLGGQSYFFIKREFDSLYWRLLWEYREALQNSEVDGEIINSEIQYAKAAKEAKQAGPINEDIKVSLREFIEKYTDVDINAKNAETTITSKINRIKAVDKKSSLLPKTANDPKGNQTKLYWKSNLCEVWNQLKDAIPTLPNLKK